MIGIIQGSKAVQMRSETFKSRLGRLKTSCGNGNAICRAVKWKKKKSADRFIASLRGECIPSDGGEAHITSLEQYNNQKYSH